MSLYNVKKMGKEYNGFFGFDEVGEWFSSLILK